MKKIKQAYEFFKPSHLIFIFLITVFMIALLKATKHFDDTNIFLLMFCGSMIAVLFTFGLKFLYSLVLEKRRGFEKLTPKDKFIVAAIIGFFAPLIDKYSFVGILLLFCIIHPIKVYISWGFKAGKLDGNTWKHIALACLTLPVYALFDFVTYNDIWAGIDTLLYMLIVYCWWERGETVYGRFKFKMDKIDILVGFIVSVICVVATISIQWLNNK